MTIVSQANRPMGSSITGFVLDQATEADFAELGQAIYRDKILVLKDQHLTSAEFIEFGRALGTVETYYEPMYHHPEYPEIFVSATKPPEGPQVGVPKTGQFWHADYSFMPTPFGITMIYPQLVPKKNRGTYFIDMGRAFQELPDDLKEAARRTRVVHSPRRYFKIRPSDVYRPISELQDEIERKTPPATHPTVFIHPVTGEEVLYLSQGLACELLDEDGRRVEDGLLDRLLAASGQLDTTFTHPNIHTQTFTEGDLLIWDNRSLVHRALHTTAPEPAVSHRVTVHDAYPFYSDLAR
ncbi:(3R)-3-[(carboxymethyl)amino]fatty acid oxygenase/decarboxylase [Micromonospora sp. NBC_01796]|uniref:(3R)-3-[(carboxymethyl)amino]fatty acid oxygenase/decarboxylase n=1 Tax=Micromonospora sp. NBC_01796 TaxID=2975987 RepID=UPI003FA3635B